MDGEAFSYHQAAQVLVWEDAQDLGLVCDIVESELEDAKSSRLAESVEAESDGENVEEGSEDGENDDGEKGGEELLIVEGDGRIKYDRRQKDVEEKVGAEFWERGDSFLVDVLTKDCPKNDTKEGAHKDENTRFWKKPLQD